MKMQRTLFLFLFSLCLGSFLTTNAQVHLLTDYFDLSQGSKKGTLVFGGIHLQESWQPKSVDYPRNAVFSIEEQEPKGILGVKTVCDARGRLSAQLYLKRDLKAKKATSLHVKVALKSQQKVLGKAMIQVHVVKQTLWHTLYGRYLKKAIKIGRLHGGKRLSDTKIARYIKELKANHFCFKGFAFYSTPKDQYASFAILPNGPKKGRDKGLEVKFETVAKRLGQLSLALSTSKKYGVEGSESHQILKEVLAQALLRYLNAFPIYPEDIIIAGKKTGKYVGDGFVGLNQHKIFSYGIVTHNWVFGDPIVLPALSLMPDLLGHKSIGGVSSKALHQALLRYYQLTFSVVEKRRAIDDAENRWGCIQDTLYSSGAWSDANLGHRIRTLLALPIIWADYNRPITYVPYWYADFYTHPPFKGFSFSPGWSPRGVIRDIEHWLTKFNIPTHQYRQSGYQPDGTISHHVGHATDGAMVAYGFEWLVAAIEGEEYFSRTPFDQEGKNLQFIVDRLYRVYPKLFYKGSMDFQIAGRSFLSDLKKFVRKSYTKAIKKLQKSVSKQNQLHDLSALKKIKKEISKNTHELSGCYPFWVNEYLVHRRGEHELPFYASLKLKSKRTVGPEDFSKPRKSYLTGYGTLTVKQTGDEYAAAVLENFDWHVLPGLTEEWRTDPLPAEGGSQASLPGNNDVAGVLADGKNGMAIYHHNPAETYSSAAALKSYFFVDSLIVALGNHIQRIRVGQQHPIVTTLDQSVFNAPLTYGIKGDVHTLQTEASVGKEWVTKQPFWYNIKDKGVVVLPNQEVRIQLKTGKKIQKTDLKIGDATPNYVWAINHGIHPVKDGSDTYAYFVLPQTKKGGMEQAVREIQKETVWIQQDSIHAFTYPRKGYTGVAFFAPGVLKLNEVTYRSNHPLCVMLQKGVNKVKMSFSNPSPNVNLSTIHLKVKGLHLAEGSYAYSIQGLYPLKGKSIDVLTQNEYQEIVIHLPSLQDEKKFHYQSVLYNGAPMCVEIPLLEYFEQ